MAASLKVRFGGEILETRDLETDVFTVGRDTGCDLSIENIGVSSRHAMITSIPGSDAYLVEDLGSANGTFVNGKRIERWYLNHNDEILVGKHTLVFKNKDATKTRARTADEARQTYMMAASEVQSIVNKMKGGDAAIARPEPREPSIIYSSGPWKPFFFLSLCLNAVLGAALAALAIPGLRDTVLDLVR